MASTVMLPRKASRTEENEPFGGTLNAKRRGWTAPLICCASGAYTALCFDSSVCAAFLWFALIPLMRLLNRTEKSAYIAVYSAVFSGTLCCLYYLPVFSLRIEEQAESVAPLILSGLYVLLCVLHTALYTAALFIGFRVAMPSLLRPLWIAFLWATAEYTASLGVFGMPMIRLGLTQTNFAFLIQTASFGGCLWLSFCMAAVNAYAAAFFNADLSKKLRGGGALCAAAIFAFNAFYGACKLSAKTAEADIPVAVVQINAPTADYDGEERFARAIALASDAQNRADLIFFPENTVFGSYAEDDALRDSVQGLADEKNSQIFLGVYGYHGYRLRNSVFTAAPQEDRTDVYSKQRLVPFFENGLENDFTFQIGTERGIFSTAYGNVGILICFESTFSESAADTAAKGAQLLFTAVNDSWFTSDAVLRRHTAQSAMRCAECGRFMVQAANDGQTCIIDSNGRIIGMLPLREAGVLYGNVAFLSELTPYGRFQERWLLFPLIFFTGYFLICRVVLRLIKRKLFYILY